MSMYKILKPGDAFDVVNVSSTKKKIGMKKKI